MNWLCFTVAQMLPSLVLSPPLTLPLLQVNCVLWTAAAPAQCPHNTAPHAATQPRLRAPRPSLLRLPPLHQREPGCRPVMWLFTARRTRASASWSSAPWTDRRTPLSSVSCLELALMQMVICKSTQILMTNDPEGVTWCLCLICEGDTSFYCYILNIY